MLRHRWGLDLPVGNANSLALFVHARECGAMDDDGLLFIERKVFCSAHAGLIGVSGRKWGPRRTAISCYVLHGCCGAPDGAKRRY
jgi:hypothetical protein